MNKTKKLDLDDYTTWTQFYGVTNAGWLLTTMDGLHINTNMQVLDKRGNVIEGQY
jgi:hypothetical protein